MCQYCRTKKGDDFENASLVCQTYKIIENYLTIDIYEDANELKCEIDVCGGELVTTKPIKINYCPICGRKL